VYVSGVTAGGSNYVSTSSTAEDVVITAATLTVAKADPAILLVSGNQYTASYVVTVNNSGTVPGTYTLSDTPGFPATGVTLDTLNVTTTGGTLGGVAFPRSNPANNTAAQISASNVLIAVGATHTYTVVITCTGSVNNGAFNTASIAGSSTASDPGCTNIPSPVVNLTLAKRASVASASIGGTVTYTFDLGNTGTIASGTSVTVADQLPAGVVATSAAAGANVSAVNCGTPSAAGALLSCALTLSSGVPVGNTTADNQYVFTITATLPATPGSVVNYASVPPTGTGTPPTPGPACAPAASCGSVTTAVTASDMTSAVVCTPNPGTVGTSVSCTVTCTNSATATAAASAASCGAQAGATGTGLPGFTAGTCPANAATVAAGGNISCGFSFTPTATGAQTVSVGTGATNDSNGGSVFTAGNNPGTTSVTVNAGTPPDLTPTFTFGFTTYNVGDARDVIMNIVEINNVQTTGPVAFFVPFSAGFNYTFAPAQTSTTIVGITYAVQNADWIMTDLGTGMLFTLRDTLNIGPRGRSRVVLNSQATQRGAKANITITIDPLAGGEVRTNNNSVVLTQSVQR
jgi:uncharacterized repeat protein (TIGR01451 family)